jgi:hypothetical protein
MGTRRAWAIGLGGGDPDPQAGEQARTEVDRHHADLVQLDPGLTSDEVDGGGEGLGVPLAP